MEIAQTKKKKKRSVINVVWQLFSCSVVETSTLIICSNTGTQKIHLTYYYFVVVKNRSVGEASLKWAWHSM